MNRREQWRPVLDAEVAKWTAKSYARLLAELPDEQVYEVQHQGKTYQVEVNILENTNDYLLIGIFVDDGSIPASFRPLSQSFIREKPKTSSILSS